MRSAALPHYASQYRRETAVRALIAKHGDPLETLATLMVNTADPRLKADCAKALAPYCYPTLKAIEVTGPGGDKLVVEVHKVSSPVSPALAPAVTAITDAPDTTASHDPDP